MLNSKESELRYNKVSFRPVRTRKKAGKILNFYFFYYNYYVMVNNNKRVWKNNDCREECIWEKFAYLSNLAVYPNNSDITELYEIQEPLEKP